MHFRSNGRGALELGSRRRGRPKGFAGLAPPVTIQALDRALDLLCVLAPSEGMTLSEIATELDQSVATMSRVLATLERRGFVEMSAATQTWHIGVEAFRLGSAFQRRTNVVERSRPVMRALMMETGETSNLGIERSGQILFVSQVETYESIRAFFPPGTLSPMHASGIGKALLSSYDDDRLNRLLRQMPLQPFTEKTLSSLPDLQAELRRTRERGYSFDDEERTVGMRCVATVIRDVNGEAVAGISVSGPTQRMSDAFIPKIGELIQKGAIEISRNLGAHGGLF